MKRGLKLLISSIVPIILLASLVAAIEYPAPVLGTERPAGAFDGLSMLLTDLLKGIGSVFETAVGKTPFGLDATIFAKMILFILVAVMLYLPAMKLTKESKPLATLIAISVSLLGVRFIDANIVNAILLPYSALTLALTTLLPMLLYGIFIYNEDLPAGVRKFGWWFFVACFLALYTWRYQSLTISAGASMIYLISGVMAVVLAISDRKIDEIIQGLKLKNVELSGRVTILTDEKAKIESDYKALIEQRDREIASGTAGPARIQDMDNRIANVLIAINGLSKSITKLSSKPKKTPKKTRNKI